MRDPWTSFTRRIPIKSDIPTLFKCWSTSAGMKQWFLRECQFSTTNDTIRTAEEVCQSGDDYLFRWHGYTDDVVEKGKILSHNGRDHIAFSFTANTEVNVWLKSYQDLVLVELTQSKILPEDDPRKNLYVQCSLGWVFYLTNLKSVLEGGIDLRNRDVDLQDMITA